MRIMVQGPGNIPLLPLTWYDVKALESVIIGYLAYRRGAVLPTERLQRERQEQEIRTLQALLARVTRVLAESEEQSAVLLFSVEELIALKEAISAYAALLMWMIPPTQEREEVLAGLRGLYRDVVRMLSPHVN